MAGAGFSNIVKNMKMTSSLSKVLETGMNDFESNSQILKNKNKNIMKYQLYTNASKIIDDHRL